MRAVFKREIQSYFYTPAAYVFMGVFVALASVFFAVGNLLARSSDLTLLISNLGYLWMLLSPVLTMRLIAGERHQKTDQLLFSSPCSLTGMVVGKYLAAAVVLLCTVMITFVYAVIVAFWGTLYVGEVAVSYLGLIMLGLCYLALDLFVSCFAKTQMTAVMLGFGVNLLLWLSDVVAGATTIKAVEDALRFISLYQRFEPFTQGQLGFANVLYNLIFIGMMLFMSVRVLDARRWSEA
ncbi:MAG: ABC transporter permease [Clostridia bacterium]|nr:ABC transporter permease [Clostridia bacterium]